MDEETVSRLREAKALFDEGILSELEFKDQKAALLGMNKAAAAAAPAKSAAKRKSEAAEVKPAAKRKSDTEGAAPAAKKRGKAAELDLREGDAGVMVSGPGTFKAKALLKESGGSWSKDLQAWVFPRGSAEEVAEALRGADFEVELTVHASSDYDRAAVVAAEKKAKEDALRKDIEDARGVAKHATLEVKQHKKAILVTGETTKVKEVMRGLQGSWNRTLNGWIFTPATLDELIKELTGDASNDVTIDPALAKMAAARASAVAAKARLVAARADRDVVAAKAEAEDEAAAEPKRLNGGDDEPKSKRTRGASSSQASADSAASAPAEQKLAMC
ncbi:hypothetical protein M885DRAFT_610982 [Pelagophyceae sp. CCMP2097]|nr:hypothetical protein M885DRAFT_610982 [Pelagophyceae sp. CCMP2097]|mmetsp:Transcript_6958/g.22574  ORF Transcript_6958/g.22574 Transcript_6958/m.22574 type:complete len:332 (+) Transcript_6958:51-1046(+)